MSRWFRLDDDVINDPKILLLPEAMRWIWVVFLCIASKNDGVLPAIDIVALQLRVKKTKAAEYITRLVAAGLIDNNDGTFAPHNWAGRQYKSDVMDPTAASRQKTYRERNKNRNGERNASVTNTDTREQNTEADTEKKKSSPLRSDDWPADFGEQFWQAYPRKTEKLSAMRKLANLRKSGIVAFVDLMAGAKRYAHSSKATDPKYVKQPTTWLNAGCWADEIQPGVTNGSGNRNGAHRSSSADFFAGIAGVAADIAGNGAAPGPADTDVPLGRVNIDG